MRLLSAALRKRMEKLSTEHERLLQIQKMKRISKNQIKLYNATTGDLRHQVTMLVEMNRAHFINGTRVRGEKAFPNVYYVRTKSSFYVVDPLKRDDEGNLIFIPSTR